ncbi:hypothetical protein LTS10_009970 [Elasticomyces elasticus]|nr:hypothetical protein LTS10_009970 [Elasticomyces elasticus]
MYIPNVSLESAAILAHIADDSSKKTGWSSLIGVVTAICGNVLISFALNTQRYAHMRLSRDRDEWEEKQKAGRREQGRQKQKHRSYGTQQLDVAEQRARKNAQGGDVEGEYTLEAPADATEADPLIPHVNSRRVSSDSDDTVRLEANEEDSKHAKSYLRSPIWWVGISLMTVGEAGNFLAYGFAPASIVSPLGVVALVSNCIIAPFLLHERFRWRDGLGVIIAIGGCVTVVLSASDSNPKLTPDKIWKLITYWEFETYLGVTISMIILLTVLSNKYGHKTILIDLGLVGLYGGYTVLSTKGIASLLTYTIWHVITFPITYLLLAVLIFTAVMQIKYLNRALQNFNATMVIPVQFVLFTLSVILGSAVLYRDFEREEAGDAIKFVGGCALTFLGVWCITSGRSDDNEEDGSELGEEDDAIDLLDEEHVQPEIREREDGEGRRQSLMAGSSQETPTIRRFRTKDSLPPSVIVTPDFGPTSDRKAWDLLQDGLGPLPPGTASAIHSRSMAELPTDGDADSPSKQPPPLHATTSEPVVPQSDLAFTLRPRTPLRRNITTDSPSRGSPTLTPLSRRASQGNALIDPHGSGPPRLLSRQSVAGLLPPLTSPFSTSISAIVADSLRRGTDNPTNSMRRRASSRRRRPDAQKRMSTAALKRHSLASGETDLEDDDVADLRAGAGSPQGRLRSLSATFGDIFSTQKRQRGDSRASVPERPEEEEEEEEEGNTRGR